MLTRRSFAQLITAALALPSLALAESDQGLADSQFSVMMWALNKQGTFEQNLERVAQAGYQHIQLVDEFKHWSEEDKRRILARMKSLGISVDAMAGMTTGFANPTGSEAFLADLKALIPIAHQLQCKQIILLSGKRIDGSSQHEASIATLKQAAEILRSENIVGVIEPIDRLENPTIYLDGVSEAFEMTKAVASPNIKVLYDLYHEQRGFGNLIEKLDNNIAEVGLIHVADVPGRHEPGTGEINYINIYKKLVQLKYKGNIAMEFYPTGDVVKTLRHAREEAHSARALATT
jgi:hydroxypyruvate isomerase